MYSVFLLRRSAADVERWKPALESSADFRLAGSATTLYQARRELQDIDVDVLATDLALEDGAAVSLVQQLRRRATAGRPKVLAVARMPADPLLFATLGAGVDSFVVDANDGAAPLPAIARMLRGECALSATLARQVLAFFDAISTIGAPPPQDERALDWSRGSGAPLRLSRGELYMLVLIAQGESLEATAHRLGLTLETLGRRIGQVCRQLQWDVRAGALALLPG